MDGSPVRSDIDRACRFADLKAMTSGHLSANEGGRAPRPTECRGARQDPESRSSTTFVDEDRDLLRQIPRHDAPERLLDFGHGCLMLDAQGEVEILDHRHFSETSRETPTPAALRVGNLISYFGISPSRSPCADQVGPAQRGDLDRASPRHHHRQEGTRRSRSRSRRAIAPDWPSRGLPRSSIVGKAVPRRGSPCATALPFSLPLPSTSPVQQRHDFVR